MTGRCDVIQLQHCAKVVQHSEDEQGANKQTALHPTTCNAMAQHAILLQHLMPANQSRCIVPFDFCRYTALQRRRLAAIEEERAALQRRQEELATAAKDAARTARMALAEQKLEELREQLGAGEQCWLACCRGLYTAVKFGSPGVGVIVADAHFCSACAVHASVAHHGIACEVLLLVMPMCMSSWTSSVTDLTSPSLCCTHLTSQCCRGG